MKAGFSASEITGPANYRAAWLAFSAHLENEYPRAAFAKDPAIKYFGALCFVSHDPSLYFCEVSQVFDVPPKTPAQKRPPAPVRLWRPNPRDLRDRHAQRALDTATRLIDASQPGNRHHARTKAAYLLGGYVAAGFLSRQEARTALEAAVLRNTNHFAMAMRTIDDCLEAGQERPVSLEEEVPHSAASTAKYQPAVPGVSQAPDSNATPCPFRNPLERSPWSIPAMWGARY